MVENNGNDNGNDQPLEPADNRKNLRTPLIVLKVKLDDGNKTFFGYAKNLGRSGLFIATVNPQEPGCRFHIEVPLPDPINRNITCDCEVVWKRQYTRGGPYEPGMGLKFLNMPEAMAQLIDEWAAASG